MFSCPSPPLSISFPVQSLKFQHCKFHSEKTYYLLTCFRFTSNKQDHNSFPHYSRKLIKKAFEATLVNINYGCKLQLKSILSILVLRT